MKQKYGIFLVAFEFLSHIEGKETFSHLKRQGNKTFVTIIVKTQMNMKKLQDSYNCQE